MAKCSKCGRKGLFFKVNENGLCKDCAALDLIAHEKANLETQIGMCKTDLSALQQKISEETEQFNIISANKQQVFDKIKQLAKADAIAEVQDKIDSLKVERDKRELEVSDITEQLNKINSEYASTQKKAIRAQINDM